MKLTIMDAFPYYKAIVKKDKNATYVIQYRNSDKLNYTCAELPQMIDTQSFYIVGSIEDFEGYIKVQELNSINRDAVKPVFTKELMVRGGVNVPEQYEPAVKVFSGEKFSVFKNENGKEYVRKNSKVKFRLIDPRTDEEKLVDDISKIIESRPSLKECAVDIINKYDIKLK